MNWKRLIGELRDSGMTQAEIGAVLGKTQGWVSAVENEQYGDIKWTDGEALRKLHTSKCGSCPNAQAA